MKKQTKKTTKSKKKVENEDQDQPRENFYFLIGNEVRFAIISTLKTFNQPLNLTKLSKLTGYSATTLIHHIPSMLERKVIINDSENQSAKKKFYSLGPKYFEIKEFDDSEVEIEETLKPLLHAEDMEINEYKLTMLKVIGELIQSKKLDDNFVNSMLSMVMFCKNQISLTVESLKKIGEFALDFKEGKTVNLDFPITLPSLSQNTFNFSSIKQINDFQAIYIKFLNELINFKKEIDQENKDLDENKLEKAYLYLFVGPIINNL